MPRLFASRLFGPQSVSGGGGSPPAAPSLTVVDNADGTGAVATVTSDSGVTNTVYVLPIVNSIAQGAWTSAGSRSDSGNVDLTLDPGHYWAIVISANSGGSASSQPVYFVVTSGEDCVHFRCLEAIVARLQLVGLSGIDSDSIVWQKVPSTRDFFNNNGETPALSMPGVLVTPLGTEAMNPQAGTNYRDEIGYPCLVTMFAADNQAITENTARNLKWRSQVAAALRRQRLVGVNEVWDVIIEPQPIVAFESWLANLWHSSLVVRCISRETRG